MDHKITMKVSGKEFTTLADILPQKPPLEILFIAKTPATKSVNAGHYFQGQQGTMFWNKLDQYNILKVPYGSYHDDYLLENSYGITDIVKVPRDFGNEPSKVEYKEGLDRVLCLIEKYNPRVICFIYKKVLDQIMKLGFNIIPMTSYGFNPELENKFDSKVFVFPMPGTPCTSEQAHNAMMSLKNYLKK